MASHKQETVKIRYYVIGFILIGYAFIRFGFTDVNSILDYLITVAALVLGVFFFLINRRGESVQREEKEKAYDERLNLPDEDVKGFAEVFDE